MIFVLFVYGLAFFACGFLILLYPKTGSALRLTAWLPALGAFGVLHGLCEWTDMFARASPDDAAVLEVARTALLVLSFATLLGFGLSAIAAPVVAWAVPAALAGLLGVLAAAAWGQPWTTDVLPRYLLCLPGAVLGAWVLAREARGLGEERLRGTARDLRLAPPGSPPTGCLPAW